MKSQAIAVLSAVGLAVGLGGALAAGQSGADSVEGHVATARAAAGKDHGALFDIVCGATSVRPAPAGQRGGGGAPQGPPAREAWHAEPVKVFDNLYFLGQTEYSVWAITTSEGIIVLDTIFDYSVEDEVIGGMKTLGLDPTKIKYAIVSHAHADHAGGAKFLQEKYGARVALSAEDWDAIDRGTFTWKPKHDIVITDGMKLTLGDTTLTFYVTPGHTAGTVSTLIPVKDRGTPHLVAEWGGTLYNFPRTVENFDRYIASAERFRDVVTRANADVAISNHTIYDNSKTKLPAILARKTGDPNPFVIGNTAVRNYLTVVDECARAALTALKETAPRP